MKTIEDAKYKIGDQVYVYSIVSPPGQQQKYGSDERYLYKGEITGIVPFFDRITYELNNHPDTVYVEQDLGKNVSELMENAVNYKKQQLQNYIALEQDRIRKLEEEITNIDLDTALEARSGRYI